MSTNHKRSSAKLASEAGRVLRDENASDIQRRLAASVVAQRDGSKQTGADMEDEAARVLASPKYSDETKALAASLVSQSNRER